MPRYFFHIQLFSGGLVTDIEGTALPDLEAAYEVARDDARALIADGFKRGTMINQRNIEIADEEGHLLGRVDFHELVEKSFPE